MDDTEHGRTYPRTLLGTTLTQDEVARRLNISAQAVSKWENTVSYPALELIPPLAELLGVPIDALFHAGAETEADECFIPMARHEKANRAYGEGSAYRYPCPLFNTLTDNAPKYVKYEPTKQPFAEEYKAYLRENQTLASLP